MFVAIIVDVTEDTDEARAFIFFMSHAIQKILDPFLIRSFWSRAPATRVDPKFSLQCFHDDAGIVGEGGQSRSLEIEARFLDRICFEGVAGFVRRVVDVSQIQRRHDLNPKILQTFLDLDRFPAIGRADEQWGIAVRKAEARGEAMAVGLLVDGGERIVFGFFAEVGFDRVLVDVMGYGMELIRGMDDGVVEALLPEGGKI